MQLSTKLRHQNSITLEAPEGNFNYLWQDTSEERTFTATESGEYWVRVGNACGTAIGCYFVIENKRRQKSDLFIHHSYATDM